MLNIRKAPFTEDLVAQKQKAIHGSRYVHLRGVDPHFDNCSIPIEILIDKVEGSMAFSMLLEDITPLDLNENTLYVTVVLDNLPANEPTINYIEDYLDSQEFLDAEGNDTYVKEYFMDRHIALFYSCGSIIDDMCYAEDLKDELRGKISSWYYKEKKDEEEPKEEEKKSSNGYKSSDYLTLEDTLNNVMRIADDVGAKLKKYYQENKEAIKATSNYYLNDYNQINARNDLEELRFSKEKINEILTELEYPFDVFSGKIECPYAKGMYLCKSCLNPGSLSTKCWLYCPKCGV